MIRDRKRFGVLAAAILPVIGAMYLRPEGAPGGAPAGGGGGGSPGSVAGGAGAAPGAAAAEGADGGAGVDDLLSGGDDGADGGEGEGEGEGDGTEGEGDGEGGAGDEAGEGADAVEGDEKGEGEGHAKEGEGEGDGKEGVEGKEPEGQGGQQRPDADAQRQAAQRQQYLEELGQRYNTLRQKLAPGKNGKVTFDAIDDGPEAMQTLMEIIQVQGQRLYELGQSDQQRSSRQVEEEAARDFWASGYQKAYPAVPVAAGKALWDEVKTWAAKNKRSQDQATARWETLMEAKVAAAKAAGNPPPKAPVTQVRTTGKPKPGAEAPEDKGAATTKKKGGMPSLTGAALKRLWGG